MKPIALLCFFIVGSMANNYQSSPPVRVSYGTSVPASSPAISYGSPPPAAPPMQTYTPPPPPPPPAAPVQSSYGSPPPASPVQSYGGYGSSSSSGSVVRAEPIPITRYNAEIRDGHHSHDFQTGNGITHQETTQIHLNPGSAGLPDDANHGKALITKTGSYSYTTPEGQTIELRYVADKDGYRPVGSHLPTPPPIPAEIAESLRLIANAAPIVSAMNGNTGYGYGYSAPAPAPAPASPPVQSYGGYSAPAPAPASPPVRSYSPPPVRSAY